MIFFAICLTKIHTNGLLLSETAFIMRTRTRFWYGLLRDYMMKNFSKKLTSAAAILALSFVVSTPAQAQVSVPVWLQNLGLPASMSAAAAAGVVITVGVVSYSLSEAIQNEDAILEVIDETTVTTTTSTD